MSSFTFPPPPPPPPKATANDAQESYSSQGGGSNNGRGGRGRGRGRGWHGQGRGNNNRGGARGGARPGGDRFQGTRGGYQPRSRGGPSQHSNSHGHAAEQQPSQAQQSSLPTHIPGGAYVNPSFGHQMQFGGQAQAQANPMAMVQAMALMSSPAGIQTMAAFTNQMADGNSNTHSSETSPSLRQESSQTSPYNHKKRKRNDANPHRKLQHDAPPAINQQLNSKPPRAKAAPPPAVPSFGFSLPTSQISQAPKSSKAGYTDIQQKRKVNLGLANGDHQDAQDSGEEVEEDLDEEAAFALLPAEKRMVFEHEGQTVSLQTPAEIAAWIKDRRKEYPTRQRVEQKAQELTERRASELEFLRKVKGKSDKPKAAVHEEPTPEQRKVEAKPRKKDHDIELQQLRQRLHQSMLDKNAKTVSGSAKSQGVDLGLGYASDTASEKDESSVMSDSSVLSSSEESSEESDEDSDNDAPPEESSSKVEPAPVKLPPPPKPVENHNMEKKPRVCPHWKRGSCNYGDRCKLSHPPREEEKKLSLYERLMEQENEKADRLALGAIKWLGQHGFLG